MVIEEVLKFLDDKEFIEQISLFAKRKNYTIFNEEPMQENLAPKKDPEEYSNWLKTMKLNISKNDEIKYSLERKTEYKHEMGNGGYWCYSNTLFIQENEISPLLKTMRKIEWDTTSDDSTDYRRCSHENTQLFSEDELAGEIFNYVKVRKI